MAKNISKLLEETEKLDKENKELHQKLREAKEAIDAIKTGNIDALVVANEKALTVYAEKTADKSYRILIEKMHEGAVTINDAGIILYSNSSFANLVNQPLQKVIGAKFKNFIDDSLKGNFDTLLEQGKKNAIKEEVFLKANYGIAIPVLISLNTFLLDNEPVLSIILTDLTVQNKNQEELKRRTKELEQKNNELESANKDLTAFTYVSSHDLQEPLRKIQNFANLILREEEKNLSDTGKEYFQRMRETASRMQALIEDLLTYSRTKSKEHVFINTNVNSILDDIIKDFEEDLKEKKATINVMPLGYAPIIPFQFRQLFQNLISNSLKFSHPDSAPYIIIKSEINLGSKLNNEKLVSKKKYYHITYTDNGIGFDPQYKDRIFEVFQRLHNKEEYKGTGMGLAICKRIVENHNGIITATGRLNKGAQFDIYIPAE